MQQSSEAIILVLGFFSVICLVAAQGVVLARVQARTERRPSGYVQLAKNGAHAYSEILAHFVSSMRIIIARVLVSLRADIFNSQEVARRSIHKRDFAIVLLNICMVLILLYGVLLWIRQTGPETYIAIRDLVLMLSFAISCMLSLCFAYELQIAALRRRHYSSLKRIARRQRHAGALKRISNEVEHSLSSPPDSGGSADKIWPADIDSRVETMAADPKSARRFLVQAGIYTQDGQLMADVHQK